MPDAAGRADLVCGGDRARVLAELAAIVSARLDERIGWYAELSAQDRSWVGLVVQAGLQAFSRWLDDPRGTPQVSADVFAIAPRDLTRAVSLGQTLELARAVVDVVADHTRQLCADPDDPAQLARAQEAVLVYSREVAFAAATTYAEAAETRGSWDARLEALVVDALLRGESDDALRSRVAALGWREGTTVTVVVGSAPLREQQLVVDRMRRAARAAADDALVGVQGDRVVVVLGTASDPWVAAKNLADLFGPGPVVVGPRADDLVDAGASARAATAGFTAARAWPAAPRPVAADDLLPERLLGGDVTARRALVDRVYRPLVDAGPLFAETVTTYLELGSSIEATARSLFVHPNTVRYRLRRVAETTGWDATQGRDAFVLRTAVAVGLLSDRPRQTDHRHQL